MARTPNLRWIPSFFVFIPVLPITFFFYAFLFIVGAMVSHTSAQTTVFKNITLPNWDSAFLYEPSQSWMMVNDSGADGGSFMIARTENATVMITKEFRSVYYNAPLWPFPVQTLFSVDSESDIINRVVDLQDDNIDFRSPPPPPTTWPESSKPAHIIFGFSGATSAVRTVRVAAADTGASGWVALVDSMIFEVEEPIASVTTGTTSSSTTASTAPLNPTDGSTPLPTETDSPSILPSIIPTSSPNDTTIPSAKTATASIRTSTQNTSPDIGTPSGPAIPPTTMIIPQTSSGPVGVTSSVLPSVPSPLADHSHAKTRTVLIALLCAVLVLLSIGGVVVCYVKKRRRETKGDVRVRGELRGLGPGSMNDTGNSSVEGKGAERRVSPENLNRLDQFDDPHIWSSQVEDAFDIFIGPSGSPEPNPFGASKFTIPTQNIPHHTERPTSSTDIRKSSNPFIFGVIDAMGLNAKGASKSSRADLPDISRSNRHTWSVSSLGAASRHGLDESGPGAKRGSYASLSLPSSSRRSSAQLERFLTLPISNPSPPDAAQVSLSERSTITTAWSRSSLASSLYRYDLMELLEGANGGLARKLSEKSAMRGFLEQAKLRRVESIIHQRSTSLGRVAPTMAGRFSGGPSLPPTPLLQGPPTRLRTSSTPGRFEVQFDNEIHSPISDRSSDVNFHDVMAEFPAPPQVAVSVPTSSHQAEEQSLQPFLDLAGASHLDEALNKGEGGQRSDDIPTWTADIFSDSFTCPQTVLIPTPAAVPILLDYSRSTPMVNPLHAPSSASAGSSASLSRPLPSINAQLTASHPPIPQPAPRRLPVPVVSQAGAPGHTAHFPSYHTRVSRNPFSSPDPFSMASIQQPRTQQEPPALCSSAVYAGHQYQNSQISFGSLSSMVTPPPQYSSRVASLCSESFVSGESVGKHTSMAGSAQEVFMRSQVDFLRSRDEYLDGVRGGLEAPRYRFASEADLTNAGSSGGEDGRAGMSTSMGEIHNLVSAEIERLHGVVDEFEVYLPPRRPYIQESRALPTPPPSHRESTI